MQNSLSVNVAVFTNNLRRTQVCDSVIVYHIPLLINFAGLEFFFTHHKSLHPA